MEGWFVRQRAFGLGKIVKVTDGAITAAFAQTNSRYAFARDAIGGDLQHHELEPGSYCASLQGPCLILHCAVKGPSPQWEYDVRYHDGRIARIPETDLEIATNIGGYIDAAQLLAAREVDSYVVFRAREDFQYVHLRNLRNLGVHRAILSSRIDLYPHQISVALEVLGDTRKRYILADEVGLGKTIEAGMVIHELLSARPEARVLIICPGTLSQQWLCELYSKFGGRIFTLLDLHATNAIQWRNVRSAIVSTTRVAFDLGTALSEMPWDMVVVDEAHHLLGTQYLYDFTSNLSRRAPWLLLLSALPAQRREDEFLRLLALLEPDRYGNITPDTLDQFRALFGLQREVGRHLKLLRLRMDGVRAGQFTNEQLADQLKRTLANQCFEGNLRLAQLAETAQQKPGDAIKFTGDAVRIISDRYRMNRRILRNRRQELLDRGELAPLQRQLQCRSYRPGPLESEALASVARLLAQYWTRETVTSVRIAFTQTLLQSLASPVLAHAFIDRAIASQPAAISTKGEDFLSLGHVTGYEDWKRYQELVRRSAREALDDEHLGDCRQALLSWCRSPERTRRANELRDLITEVRHVTPAAKLLIFAGFPGLAAELVSFLKITFGEAHVVQFTYDLSREEKEVAARNFEIDSSVWVMVSDESGGEGRNFQFATALIHVDQPWHVSRVEQRIGRLDRLGRAQYRSDVISHVLFCADSVEEGLVRCYSEGLNVYTRSISGLEFALRDTELKLTTIAAQSGIDGLLEEILLLKTRADQERSRDDAEAVLDAASFDAGRASRGKTVLAQSEIEPLLEQAFIKYFQLLSSTGSASRWIAPGVPVGFWRLRPDSIRAGVLTTASDSLQVVGTFQRSLAQKRLDYAYFQLGNPVYDELSASLESNSAGKIYAISSRLADSEPWMGFEFTFRPVPDDSVLRTRPDLRTRCAAMLTMGAMRVFISTEGIVETDVNRFTRLRKKLTKENKDTIWRNLTKDKARHLDAVFPGREWSETVLALHAAAATVAIDAATTQFGAALAADISRLRRQASELRENGEVIAVENARELEMVADALTSWNMRTDTAGFLAINIDLAQGPG